MSAAEQMLHVGRPVESALAPAPTVADLDRHAGVIMQRQLATAISGLNLGGIMLQQQSEAIDGLEAQRDELLGQLAKATRENAQLEERLLTELEQLRAQLAAESERACAHAKARESLQVQVDELQRELVRARARTNGAPVYDNTNIADQLAWTADNNQAIVQWHSVCTTDDPARPVPLAEFAAGQYAIARESLGTLPYRTRFTRADHEADEADGRVGDDQ